MKKVRATLGSTGVFADVPAPPKPADAATGQTTTRPDREGRVPSPFWMTAAAKKQLRLLAAEIDGGTQQELLTEALNLLFQKHGKPPIA